MKSLIAAELLKVRTTRALLVAGLVTLAYVVIGPVLVAVAPEGATMPHLDPAFLAEAVRSPARLAGGAMLLVGLLSATGEFGHGTILTTRLAEPHSGRVLGAKTAALSLIGLAFGVVLVALPLAAGALILSTNGVSVQPFDHGVPRTAATVVALMVLHAALGVALGILLRNTAAAVGTVLMWVFVVEGVIPVVARRPEIADWLPGGAVSEALAERAGPGQLAPGAAAALLLGYAALVIVAAAITDRLREL